MARQRTAKTAEGADRPKRWWQWLLIYPALGVALLTAAPQWLDKIQALANNVQNRTWAEAVEQRNLFEKNISCTRFPFVWNPTPSHVNVDATLCDSGDVFVTAQMPGGKLSSYIVPLSRVTDAAGAGGGAPIAALILPERAFARPAISSAIESPAQGGQCQQQATVICTKFIDNRHLLRLVSTPDGCFEQVTDTFTGQQVRSTKVPCRQTC